MRRVPSMPHVPFFPKSSLEFLIQCTCSLPGTKENETVESSLDAWRPEAAAPSCLPFTQASRRVFPPAMSVARPAPDRIRSSPRFVPPARRSSLGSRRVGGLPGERLLEEVPTELACCSWRSSQGSPSVAGFLQLPHVVFLQSPLLVLG